MPLTPERKTVSRPAYADDFIGPREPHTIIQVPFPGFYESSLSYAVDSHIEQEAEYMAERDSHPEHYPDDAKPECERLDAETYADLLNTHLDYRSLETAIASAWVQAIDARLADDFMALDLKFESMSSPREYNFTTDRVFAHIPLRTARALVRKALATKRSREILREHIVERHESRSGFASWYPSDASSWASMIRRFMRGEHDALDHNELQTILEAVILAETGDLREFERDVEEYAFDGDGISQDVDGAMNWTAFDAAVAEARAEAREEWLADWNAENPGVPPPAERCPVTPDMLQASGA